jgi:GrpB-like predicted nucleotidyltransferase (UPF0157 family)
MPVGTSEEDSITIHEYDPSWPALFAKLAARIQTALGDLVLRVEHVGSTAVPGLAAKPVIDLDVVLPARADVAEAIRLLAGLGYEHEGDLGIPGRNAFGVPEGEPRHHLYLLLEGASELRRHLAFREALRRDPALRARYASLKRSLATMYARDRSAYTEGKSAFIEAAVAAVNPEVLVFRQTLPSDIEELFSVRARTRDNAFSKEELASIGITPESIAEEMTGGRMKGWVCLDSSSIVGFCNGDANTGEVLVLAVLSEYECRGIGSRLLSHAVEWLRSAGFNTIWLAASPDTRLRAHGFYRSLGWRPNGKKLQNGDEILELKSGAQRAQRGGHFSE